MGKLTINLCEELHQKIREDVAADESLTTGLLMERIIREHYEGPKPRPRIESGGRTMAFSVSEELFQRVKRYLAAHGGQSQRDFVIGLVTQGLALWEQGKALKMLEGYTPQKGDRTLAFAVTEELFHQIKAYLAAHKKLSQKEFMVSLVENAVSAWEAGAEADGIAHSGGPAGADRGGKAAPQLCPTLWRIHIPLRAELSQEETAMGDADAALHTNDAQ